MDTQRFKTTIKCTGCIEKVTPYLNEAAGKDNWQVDLQNSDKVLTIATGKAINEEVIAEALQKAGYKAERLG